MNSLVADVGLAFWMGIRASFSSELLFMNIAAASFVASRIKSTRAVLLAGLLYALGCILACFVTAMLAGKGLASQDEMSGILQHTVTRALGPLMLFSGILIFGRFGHGSVEESEEDDEETEGKVHAWPAFLFGMIFALSYFPGSAGLFFDKLLPMAVKDDSLLEPVMYGCGAALPILIFSLLLSMSARTTGLIFRKSGWMDLWLARITGVVFIIAGVYFTLCYDFSFLLRL